MPRSPGALASASIPNTVESTFSGPAFAYAGKGKSVETTRFGKMPYPTGASTNRFSSVKSPTKTSKINTSMSRFLPKRQVPEQPAVVTPSRTYKTGIGGTSKRHVKPVSPVSPNIFVPDSLRHLVLPEIHEDEPVASSAAKRNYRSGPGGTSKRHYKAPVIQLNPQVVNPVSSSAPIQAPATPGPTVKSSSPIQPAGKAPSRSYKSPLPGAYTRTSRTTPVQAAVQSATKPGPTSHAVSKAGRSMWGLGIAAAAIAAVGLGTMMFSGKGSEYNSNPGLTEQGVAAGNRQHSTDFGSPYQGIWGSVSSQLAGSLANGGSTPNYVNGVPINQEVSDFRDQQMQTPLQKRIIEAEMTKQSLKSMNRLYFLDPNLTTQVASQDYGLSGTRNLQRVDLSQVDWSVEDADTIVMRQGVRGLMGQEMQVRLAGIDAPEIQHNDESIDMLRYKQGQPHGEEARARLQEILANAKNVEVVSDPTQATYGRGLGVLYADGENVNLQLIKEGHVAALPFGERSADLLNRDAAMNAERAAYQGHRGMWQNDYWRTYRNSVSEYSRVTFNTLTRVDKLAGNMNLAGLEATMSMAQEEGPSKLTYMSQNALRPKLAMLGKKREFKDNTFTVDYHTQAKHLDQLKLETQRHMNTYGNQAAENIMSSSKQHVVNQNVVSDSMSNNHSIYNDELPTIIDKYTRKAGKRKLHAEAQRSANKFMHTKNRYGGE
jgi:endonuclease YncB( thermonuclease family)